MGKIKTVEPLTPDQIQDLRAMLEAEHDSLTDELSTHGKQDPTTGMWEGTSDDGDGFDEADPIDVADNLEEMTINVPLVAELQTRLREVEDALARIERGTYGICEVGREPILLDRLEANPAARTCVVHAQ